ncbi:MAG: glycoside hydrolase family 9 protein [Chitinispirillaceae bacterium]
MLIRCFHFLTLSLFLLQFSCTQKIATDDKSVNEKIRINQIGYYSNAPKYVVVADSITEDFCVVDENGRVMYESDIDFQGLWDASGEILSRGDFSSFSKSGTYRIYIRSLGFSPEFKISSNLYKTAFRASLKSFYYQRASMDLDSAFAGVWARKAGHPDTACILHESTGRKGVRSSPRGWYDAGDFGKYVVNAGITTASLMSLHERFPALVSDSFTNIPESRNGKSDLLDEIKYELDWLKTMQDEDGGVFFKLAGLSWPGVIMPHQDTLTRYIIGKSTTSSLCFAAVMAQASRLFSSYDSAYAQNCLQSAKRAYSWAVENPSAREPEEGGGSGGYGVYQHEWIDTTCAGSQYLVDGNDAYRDEFLWAAAELFISSGDKTYGASVKKHISEMTFRDVPAWWDLQGMAYYSLLTAPSSLEVSLKDTIKTRILTVAEKHLGILKENPYQIPYECFFWGSNASFMNIGILFSYAYDLTGDQAYLDALTQTVDYVFGKNPVGISYVTGVGDVHSRSPHHRQCGADGIDRPIPGFLVGGPNAVRQDDVEKVSWGAEYIHHEPARSYVDDDKSYASNEVAINWTSSLVHCLGYLYAKERLGK